MERKNRRVIDRIVLGFVLLAGGLSPAWADNFEPWTTVGSAGTVDEGDTGIAVFSLANVTVSGAAALPANLDIRYNIVAVDGLLQGGDGILMTARFRDNGAGARVILRLREVDLSTGIVVTRLTLDSNSFAASNAFQTQSTSTCTGNFFDFNRKAYFIEAVLQKSAADGAPGLTGIRVGFLLC